MARTVILEGLSASVEMFCLKVIAWTSARPLFHMPTTLAALYCSSRPFRLRSEVSGGEISADTGFTDNPGSGPAGQIFNKSINNVENGEKCARG